MTPVGRAAMGIGVAGVVLVLASVHAAAEAIDPTLAHGVTVAPSTAASLPSLTRAPTLAFRTRLQGAIDVPPTVTPQGAILIAATDRVTELDRAGSIVWSHRIRSSAAATRPVIGPDGSRALVTTRGGLLVLGPDGKLVVERQLPVTSSPILRELLATPDGTLIVAAGTQLLACDFEGNVLAATETQASILAVTAGRPGFLITTVDGVVERWHPGVDQRTIGSFGGAPSVAVPAGPRRLLALLDATKLVELDTTTGRRSVRARTDTTTFTTALAVARDGTAHIVTGDGLLATFDTQGQETRRVLMGPSTTTFGGSMPVPELLLGRGGRLAFVLPGDLGVIAADGAITRHPDLACAEPVALAAAGQHRLVVACRSGLVLGLRTAK